MKFRTLDILIQAYRLRGLTRSEIHDVLEVARDLYKSDMHIENRKINYQSQDFIRNYAYKNLEDYVKNVKKGGD